MSVSALRAAFDIEYAGAPPLIPVVSWPAPDDTFTSRPWPLSRSSGANAIATRHAPSVFVSSASLTTSRSAVSTLSHVS
jgi:hypothetical protein